MSYNFLLDFLFDIGTNSGCFTIEREVADFLNCPYESFN